MLADLLARDAHKTAFYCGSYSATRGELREAGERAAAWLAHLGFVRGDVLALWLPDGGAWLQLLFGAAKLGVLVVPINTRYRLQEARHVVETARARALVVAPVFLGTDYLALAREIQAGVAGLRDILEVAHPEKFIAVDATLPAAPATGGPRDGLCTFSTSGTTGNPKLAVHDQAGIAQHAFNAVRAVEIKPESVLLLALSLYGVYGFVQALGALAGGAACVFMQVYEAKAAAEMMDRHGATHFFGTDAMFEAVMNVPGTGLGSWRIGGLADFAGMAAQVVERAERERGIRLVGLYGSSECFALTSTQRLDDPLAQRSLAGGLPVSPAIEVRAADAQSGAILPDGELGELQIRGYNVMTGYLNNPAATAQALSPDGWFRTGDLGYTSEGRFVYLSRLKDSLRLRGYLVDPTEIEEFLGRHPGLIDAQVVGVNRVGEGDVAIAFARRRDPAVEEARVIDWCRQGIATYKVPRRIVFVDDYPRSDGPNGTKILKVKMREMAQMLA